MAKAPPSRFKMDIRINKKGKSSVATTRLDPCENPGCTLEGTCRVPKARDNLTEHIWLCTAHARKHNESWDFFQGMSDRDIERFREEALVGHRPTWPLGKRGAKAHNPFGVFDFDGTFGGEKQPKAAPEAPRRPERHITRLQMTAFDTLQLEPSATLNDVKARYKELVKRFHPDANGGDRGAEERLKQVIKAYGVLRASRLA